jgi:predicted RND superfamily exporter protein
MGFVQRRLLKLVLGVVHRPKLTLLLAGVALVACVAVAMAGLRISTDTNRLFSSNVGFFRHYLDFIRKFPENEALYIIVESKDPGRLPPVGRWTELADRLTDRLRQNAKHVQSVDSRVPLDKLGAQGLLFEDPNLLRQNLDDVKRFAPLAKLWGEGGPLINLLGRSPISRFLSALNVQKPDADTVSFVNALSESWVTTLQTTDPLVVGKHVPDLATLGATDPSRLGYYYVPDETNPSHRLLLVRIFPKVQYDSLTAVTQAVDSIRATMHDVAKDYPEFTVGLTGRPALDADEMRTTDHDTHRAEVVALIIVFIGMAVMLKSIWLALVAEISLAVGIGWTFGWATISIGELNLLSIVFVIALIGIGMDYLVQILTRYRREAQRYVRASAVWARVFRYVSPPIFTACLGAAGAFFVSLFTDFRGAADLGIIAGGGLLLCLFAGYTVLPAILVLFPAKLAPIDEEKRYTPPPVFRRHPAFRLILPALWIAAILAGIPFARQTKFSPNLLELQAPDPQRDLLVRKVQTWFAVVLSKDIQKLRAVRESVKDLPVVKRTESVLNAFDNYQWLQQHQAEIPKINWKPPAPVDTIELGTIADKSAKLADHIERDFSPTTAPSRQEKSQTITHLRAFQKLLKSAPKEKRKDLAQRLSTWQEVFVDQLKNMLKQFSPAPLDIAQVPEEIRSHLVSADGTYALYLYPSKDLWDRASLAEFVTTVEKRIAAIPDAPHITGIAPNIYHSTNNIEKAFYKATFYALALVFILVFLDLRRLIPTLLAVSVLALGLPMLVAIMGLRHIDWNFANFFGLPILIGAGHEYGVFMIHRYLEVQHNPRRVWGRWDVSDRALLLCAFITSSSFGFFWALGHHEGLKSLGLVMALGTCCIYLATIMVLRPILRWRIERLKLYDRR